MHLKSVTLSICDFAIRYYSTSSNSWSLLQFLLGLLLLMVWNFLMAHLFHHLPLVVQQPPQSEPCCNQTLAHQIHHSATSARWRPFKYLFFSGFYYLCCCVLLDFRLSFLGILVHIWWFCGFHMHTRTHAHTTLCTGVEAMHTYHPRGWAKWLEEMTGLEKSNNQLFVHWLRLLKFLLMAIVDRLLTLNYHGSTGIVV